MARHWPSSRLAMRAPRRLKTEIYSHASPKGENINRVVVSGQRKKNSQLAFSLVFSDHGRVPAPWGLLPVRSLIVRLLQDRSIVGIMP